MYRYPCPRLQVTSGFVSCLSPKISSAYRRGNAMTSGKKHHWAVAIVCLRSLVESGSGQHHNRPPVPSAVVPIDMLQQRQQSLQQRCRRWRAAGNVQIDGQDGGDAALAGVASLENTTIGGAAADRDDPFWIGRR